MEDVVIPEGLIKPEYELVGHDGGAMQIIGGIRLALKREGNHREVIESFTNQAMAGDYDHLLRVAMSFTEFPG